MCNPEWLELNNIEDVARAKVEGWKIEIQSNPGNDKYCPWKLWDGGHWHRGYLFRGRPKQPKKITVTSECWRHAVTGSLYWLSPHESNVFTSDWQRFPAGDLTGEIEE